MAAPWVTPTEGLDLDAIQLPLERWGFAPAPVPGVAPETGEAAPVPEPASPLPEVAPKSPPRYGFAALAPPAEEPLPPPPPIAEQAAGLPAPPPPAGEEQPGFFGSLRQAAQPLVEAGQAAAQPFQEVIQTEQEIQELARDPERLAIEQGKAETAVQTEIGARVGKTQTAMAKAQAEYKKAMVDARAQLQQIDEDASKADDRWWATRSTPQKAAAYVAAIFGGMLSPYRGGKNQGLEMILGEMKNDFDQQMQLLSQKRGTIQALYQQSGDLYQAQMTYQMGQLQNVETIVRAKMAKLDPRGTQVRNGAKLLRGILADKAKAQAEAEQQMFKNQIELRQVAATEKQARAAQTSAGASWRNAQTSRGEANIKAEAIGKYIDERGNLQPIPGWKPPESGLVEEVFDPETGTFVQVGAPGGAWAKGLSPVEQERRLTLKATRQREQAGRVIVDVNGQVLGLGRGTDAQNGELRDRVSAHGAIRKTMAKMMGELLDGQSLYKGLGSDRWPSEKKARLQTYRIDLANMLAKVRDPTSVNRESEIEAALKEIPDVDGWVESRKPWERYKTLMQTADDVLEGHLVTKVEGYNKDDRKATAPFKQIDEMLKQASRPPEEVSRSAIISEALEPLPSFTRKDEAARSAALAARVNRLDWLRQEEMSEQEFQQIKSQLEGEVKSGALKATEAATLLNTLAGARERPAIEGGEFRATPMTIMGLDMGMSE